MRRAARPLRPPRGALLLIAALLAGSAVMRLAAGPGPAIAREIGALAGAAATGGAESCAPDPEIEAMLAAITDRQEALGRRELSLADREAAVALAEEALAETLAALEAAEARLAETLALADGAAEEDLDRLTAVYENMKPKEAAALFEEMAPEFAAGFLGRMRPDAAAEVMAGLSPGAAYTISVLLAGRNAAAPTE